MSKIFHYQKHKNKSSFRQKVRFHDFLYEFSFFLKLAFFQAKMIDIPDRSTNWASNPGNLTRIESPWHKAKFLSHFKSLELFKLFQEFADFTLEIVLHTIDSPESSSENNIFTQIFQTLNRHGIKHFQKAPCDVMLLIFVISVKDLKVDFFLIKFEL